MNNTHYVYILIDPRTDQPFYVGKGQRRRMQSHESEAKIRPVYWSNKAKCQQINDIWAAGLQVVYDKIECLSDQAARSLEISLIDEIGRLSTGTGSLTNTYPGGGGHGHSGNPVYQFNLDGTLVECHPSSVSASEKTGIAASTISACLVGNQRSSGKFLWSRSPDSGHPYTRQSEKRKRVYRFTLSGQLIDHHECAADACAVLGLPVTGCHKISAVCSGKLNTYNGYVWSYDRSPPAARLAQQKAVVQIDSTTNAAIAAFPSIVEAVRSTGVSGVSACCNGKQLTAGGYKWQFDNGIK